MRTRHHTSLAEAYSPDADRAGQDASAHLPEWLVHFLARIIFFLLRYGRRHGRSHGAVAWFHHRPDLPPGSAQAEAASIRGTFGRAIEWMCRRHGIGPGHPDWPELSRAIVAFGGSVQDFRPGLPACGLQWWETPEIVPGLVGMAAATPAADAMAVLLARQADRDAPPALIVAPAAAEPAVAPAPRRRDLVRAGTGPPTGPPPDPLSGASSGPHRKRCYAVSTGPRHGRPRHPDSCHRHAATGRFHTRSYPVAPRDAAWRGLARRPPARPRASACIRG